MPVIDKTPLSIAVEKLEKRIEELEKRVKVLEDGRPGIIGKLMGGK